jgi:hypothetical protein
VILTTHDRPHFLPVALGCYRLQTHPARELIVVDDGPRFPVDAGAVAAAGGRLLRLEAGTPIGEKLNRGLALARGPLCQKMDDDDWYGPHFLETMLAAYAAARADACRPSIAYVGGILQFDLAVWEIHRAAEHQVAGGTLFFALDDWLDHPFRPLPRIEDSWFVNDHVRVGGTAIPVSAVEEFVQVRHHGNHLWHSDVTGRSVEQGLREQPLYHRSPEELFPDWALAVYRERHRQLAADGPAGTIRPPAVVCPLPAAGRDGAVREGGR